jgi:hypothetical protein
VWPFTGNNAPAEEGSSVARHRYEVAHFFVLILLVGVPTVGTFWFGQLIESDLKSVSPKDIADALKETHGLSPAIQACYTVRFTISSIIISCGLGAALGITYLFGNFLYRRFHEAFAQERLKFWTSVAANLKDVSAAELPELVLGFVSYEQLILDRRNVYWRLFLRSTLALIVVSIIALLIAACKIESQAGLPIISGIIAFIIGQGTDILHSPGHPQPSSRGDRFREPSNQQPSSIGNQPSSVPEKSDGATTPAGK